MKSLLEKVREEYDIVIIDTPPVGQVTDAAILAGITDGVILVLASGQFIGAVLTKLDVERAGYYSYKYE